MSETVMNPDVPETFSFSREIGHRLKELRVRAGLTQADVAELMGRNRVQVTRLEGGHNLNPGIGLVADFLRAVQAHFDDLSDLLRRYTGLPRPIEVETRKRVVGMLRDLPRRPMKQADSYDIKTSVAVRFGKKRKPLDPETRLKRVQSAARAAVLNEKLDRMLKREVGDMKGLSQTERHVVLAAYGRKVWGILVRTRPMKPGTRERHLAKALEHWSARNPELRQAFEHMQVAVQAFYQMMENTGELDWRPAYKAVEKEPRRKRRPETPEQRERRLLREGEKRVARGSAGAAAGIIDLLCRETGKKMAESGVSEQRFGDYRRWLDALFMILYGTRDDPALRKERVEGHLAICTIPDEARKAAEAFTREFEKRKDRLPKTL